MINKVILHGRVVNDIELKEVGGFPLAEFRVAWSEKYGETETKCFLSCKAWRKTAETISQRFHKGKEILIEGKLVTEEWEKDGQKQSKLVCTIEKFDFCGPNDGQASNTSPKPAPEDFVTVPDTDSEELPFV